MRKQLPVSPKLALAILSILSMSVACIDASTPFTGPPVNSAGSAGGAGGGSGGGSAGGSGGGSAGGSAGGSGGGHAGGSGGGSAGGSGGGSAGGSGGGSAGGSGGGSAGGSGGGSAGGSGGGSAGGSGGGSAGGSGGGSAGGSGGGSAGGSGGGSGGGTATSYCDGFVVKDASQNIVNIQTYMFNGTLTSEGCATTIAAYADGNTINTVSGILDLDAADNGAGSPAPSIIVSNCGDLGLSGFTDQPNSFTAPSGSMTVTAAYGSSATNLSVYGVVTAVNGWGISSASKAYSGTLYLEDPTPSAGAAGARSGTQFYFPAAGQAVYGTVPSVGDVVNVTNLKWDPYKGVNEFEASSTTTTVTKVGTAPLPTLVSLAGTVVDQTATLQSSGYQGMRVTVTGGPFTVGGSGPSNTCPGYLQYTPTP